MKLFSKLKWIVIISVVFALVLATNLIDKRNFKSISDSIVSIYEDQLVVKNIILDMATTINQKEVAFLTQDTVFLATENAALTKTLKDDIQKFEEINLTGKEAESLGLLTTDIDLMLNAEKDLVESQFANYDKYNRIIKELNSHLDGLAHIQMQEGKKQFITSQRKMSTIELFTQLETYFLIILAVIALVIVLYNPQK